MKSRILTSSAVKSPVKSPLRLSLLHPGYWISHLGFVVLLLLAAAPLTAQEVSPRGDAESTQTTEVTQASESSESSEITNASATEESSEAIEVTAESTESPDSTIASEVDCSLSPETCASTESTESTESTKSQDSTIASEATTQPTLKILSPTPDEALPRPAVTVVIEAPLDSIVTMEANGVPVDPNQIGQVSTDGSEGVMRQVWYGVVFGEGENLLTVTATLPDGTVQTTEQTVMLRGAIESLNLETLEAQVPADGRSTVTVRGYFLDKNGNLSNRGARVTLSASAGTFVGADLAPDVAGFQVDASQGEFRVELQSGVETGLVQIRAEMLDLKAETQVQFGTPQLPDGLVAGVIDLRIGPGGTDYFSRFGDFLPLEEKGTTVDVDAALFLRGSFGDWLLTGAFNSDRDLNESCTNCTGRLRQADQPSEKPYPTYGDESKVTHLTPSEDQVYLRLERTSKIPFADPDYVMWGSYSTGEEFATNSQEFTAFSRQLQGAKLNYNIGNLQVSGLYGQGGEAFQRDTVLPDGTRGFYFLSQRLVVPGSEEVYEELEVLERPGTVVYRERLNRVTDYEIDYDRGTVFFNEPQLRTEIGDNGDILVRRLIIAYQHDTSGSDASVYGGRLQYHFDRQSGRETAIGATYLQEDKGDREFSLYGADLIYSFGKQNQLIAEYAHSENDTSLTGNVRGDAYRVELTGMILDTVRGRAYYRHADTGFANQSTISFVPGQTRYGAELDSTIGKNTTLRLRYDHEDNEGVSYRPYLELGDLLDLTDEPEEGTPVDNSLTTISAGVQQRFGKINLTSDWIYRDRSDRLNPDRNSSSSQIQTVVTAPVTDKLRLRLLNQTTISASTDSLYSDRTQLGIDWRLLPGLNLQVNQDWFTRGTLAGQTRTSVNLGGDYNLNIAKNTSISARYGMERYGDGGWGDNLGLGLKHGWEITPGLKLDLAYERTFTDLFMGGLLAVGQGGSRSTRNQSGNSLSVGVNYTDNPNWQASGRFEYRDTAGYDTINVSGDLSGKVTSSLTSLISFDRAFAAGSGSRSYGATTTLRVGMAYRNPKHDRLNALLRYEYRQNPSIIPETLLIGRGTGSNEHLLATEVIYAPHWRWEFYGKAGVRLASSYIAEDYTGRSTIALTQLRARYQINRRFDVVGEARWIGQSTANYHELGFLAEVGYHLTPNIRLAAGYSSGSVNNDRDFSGSRSDGGVYGGVTVKLDRLFEGFGLQKPLPAPEAEKRIIRAEVDDNTLQAALPGDAIQLNLSQTLRFDGDGTSLTPDSMVVLDSLATLLTEYPDMQVDLQAHLGPLATLQRESVEVRQMQIARSYLLQQGVKNTQLVVRSLGGEAIADLPIGLILSGSSNTFTQLSARLADPTQDLLDKVLPILDGAETATVSESEPLASTTDIIPAESLPTEPLASTTDITTPESLPTEVSGTPATPDQLVTDIPDTLGTDSLATAKPVADVVDQPLATAQPVPVSPQALLPTFLLENLNDRLPDQLTPTLLSLTLFEIPLEPVTIAPNLDRILELALLPRPEEAPRISLLLEDLIDPILEARRPVESQPLATAKPVADVVDQPLATAQPVPVSPQALLPTFLLENLNDRLPDQLTPTLLSLTLFEIPLEPVSLDPNLDRAILLTLAPNPEPPLGQSAWLLTLLPNDRFTPLALLPLNQVPIALLPRPETNLQASATPSDRDNRRLNAALRFLLSQDISALDTLLQASGGSPQPKVSGQVINLDQL